MADGWGPLRLTEAALPLTQAAARVGPRRLRLKRWAFAVALGDATVAIVVIAVAVLLRFGGVQIGTTRVPYGVLCFVAAPGWVTALWFGGAYDLRFMSTGAEEYRRIINVGIWVLALIGFISFAVQASVSRSLVAAGLPSLTVGTMMARLAYRTLLRRRLRSNRTLHRTVIVGGPDDSAALKLHMERAAHIGFSVIGVYIPMIATGADDESALLPPVETQSPGEFVESVLALGADTIAVTHTGSLGPGQLRRLSWALEGSGIDLLVAPSLTDVAGPRVVVRPAQGLPLLHIEEPELHGAKRLAKGALDRVVAALLVIAAIPVIAGIAVAIRASDGGSVFYRQVRVGRLGKEFIIWKFRTMTSDAEGQHGQLLAASGHGGLLFKLADDPRVTSLGRFLRRHSLDELPQLLNVLSGSMSLVGPRPQRPLEVAQYASDARRRLLVKPGMTGLWQVSGRNALTWEETIQLDLHYVDNWSMSRDLVILAKTAWAVLRGSGAY